MRSQILSRHLRVFDEEMVSYPKGAERPRTRGDCLEGGSNAIRPCPWISCRHHLAIDVTKSGSVSLPWRDTPLEELEETCSLDVAERGGMTLEDVGALMNVTRERTRQLEEATLAKLSGSPMTRFLVGMARAVADDRPSEVRRRVVAEPVEEEESSFEERGISCESPHRSESVEPEEFAAAAFALHG